MSPGAELAESLAPYREAGAFLLIDKPPGPSSHQVTAWVRDLLGLDRAGHAGTLDPGVSGLLWVGIGRALRLLPLVLQFPKRYVGVVQLHGEPDGDALGRVLAEFAGPVFQTPPVRSAVRRARRVRTIHRLELLERQGPALLIEVSADSGTYVRTLAVDLGEALGVGAHLAELRRVATGPFTEAMAVSLTELGDDVARARAGDLDGLRARLHPIVEVWQEFPQLTVRAGAASAIAHGADLAAGGIVRVSRPYSAGAPVVLLDEAGGLLALGRALQDSRELGRRAEGWVVDAGPVLVDPKAFPLTWRAERAAAR